MRLVTGALGEYTSDTLVIAEKGNRVFAKLRLHGFHHEELLGVPPSGRHVWWYGMPMFAFDGLLVRDLWVLGEIHNLMAGLRSEKS